MTGARYGVDQFGVVTVDTQDAGDLIANGWKPLTNPGAPTGAWSAYTPVVTTATGTITTYTAIGRYFQIGKLVHFHIHITITTNGTGADRLDVTLPLPAFITATRYMASGMRLADAFGLVAQLFLSSGTLASVYLSATGAYPGADATDLVIDGAYEAA